MTVIAAGESGKPQPHEATTTTGRGATAPRPGGSRRRRNLHGPEPILAWVFVAPMVVVAVLFLIVPIVMALWVSVSDWGGRGSPLSSSVGFVGFENYAAFFSPGLAQRDLSTSIRNTMYFVLLVVPLQTMLALGLALVLNSRRLKAKSFFRTAYYFPSVTSSVAIAVVFLFMFSASGPVNSIFGLFGIKGPNWFADPRGLIHLIAGVFGVDTQPGWASGNIAGISLWQWLSGPSVAMISIIALVVWVSAGGYMLIFLSSLQGIDEEVNEAAVVDGANTWQRIRFITVPILRPTTTLVVTLGLIGTWQVFDQVYIMSQGNPGKTTLTPAYLGYTTSFSSAQWGQGTAISFMLFALIVVLTIVQRAVTKDRENPSGRRKRAAGKVAS